MSLLAVKGLNKRFGGRCADQVLEFIGLLGLGDRLPPELPIGHLTWPAIFATIRRINQAGTTILLVEQNTQEALSLAHRGYVLENGRVALEGEAGNLLANEHVKTAYLGV